MKTSLTLSILPETLSVCRFSPASDIPSWAFAGEFFSLTRTADELSLVCAETHIPADVQAENGWRGFKVEGPLDFALVGILARLTGVLAHAGISLFAVSTYETDYILVKADCLSQAVKVLSEAGYFINYSS